MNFKILLYTTLIGTGFILSSCNNSTPKQVDSSLVNSSQNQPNSFKNISPEDAKKRLDSDEKIILLDVRTIEEYSEIHIPETTLIPLNILESEAQNKLTNKDVPIFVYCRSGNRSVTASNILLDLGYKDVYNLGGIIDWPYEKVSSPKYNDGTYNITSDTYLDSYAEVIVTIENNKITNIQWNDTGKMAHEGIQSYIDQYIQHQNLEDIDTISGASNTLKIFKNAIDKALAEASY